MVVSVLSQRPPSAVHLRRWFGLGEHVGAELAENVFFGAALLIMLGLVGLPLCFVVISAFLVDPFDPASGWSLSTIMSVYASNEMWSSTGQTLLMSVVVGAASTAIGGTFAWILTRFRLPASGTIEALVLVPIFLSPLVGAMSWIALAAPRSGLINNLLVEAHLSLWVRLNVTSITGIAFVMTLHYVPYGYLFLAGTLRNCDPAFEDASYLCGAGVLRTGAKILIPLLRAPVMSSVLFIAILAAGEFSVPAALGSGTSYEPLAVRLYDAVYGFPQDYPRAAAIGTLLVIISMTAFYFYRRSIREGRRFVTVTGRGFAMRQVNPGRWRPWLLAGIVSYIFVTVILPYAALVFVCVSRFRTGDLATTEFTFDNIRQVIAHPEVASAVSNTILISLLVPALCVLVALVLVYGQDRLRSRLAGFAVNIATVPIAVSGIVFGTGILVVYIRTPLYATIWVIVVALFAHYIAHGVRICGNGMLQIDPSLEEAARLNGAGQSRVLSTIMMPLLKPSLLAAFILIYVFAVREVNTAILLYSPTSMILSVLTWNYLSDGSLAQAAVVGLLQTLLMFAGFLLVRLVFKVSATSGLM